MATVIGSLFSGIGGLELGLERAGLGPVAWQVEKDPYASAVLAKHWPNVERHTDVHEVGAHNLEPVDIICGGFPCQDISLAGNGAGLAGARSGLWFEYLRIVRELRPRFVLVENVAALRSRGLSVVLGGLAESGYDAEWDCIPAVAAGAPHRRDRLFIVARQAAPDAERAELRLEPGRSRGPRGAADSVQPRLDGEARAPANADGCGLEGRAEPNGGPHEGEPEAPRRHDAVGRGLDAWCGGDWGTAPPAILRVDDGVRERVDHRRDGLRCLGNAVLPQVAEWIGKRIVAAEAARRAA